MIRRGLGWLAILLLVGCAASREAERTQALHLQELQGRAEDLEQRLAFEAGEKDALTGRLKKAQDELAACRPEVEAERRRAAEWERRLRQCEETEGGLRADQDLGRRARVAAEQERDELRRQAKVAREERAADAAALHREIEDCRGRLADTEAQASLLGAERRKGELVARERVDEVTANYDRLLQEARKETEALRQRISEAEAALDAERSKGGAPRLEAFEAAERLAHAQRSRRAEDVVRLREAFAVALGDGAQAGSFSLVPDEARAAVTVPLDALFGVKGTELKPGAREVLQRLAQLLAQVDLPVTVEAKVASVPGELAKRFPTPWDLAAAHAAKVARWLEKEGVVGPGRLEAIGSRLAEAKGSEARMSPAVTLEVKPPEAAPPETAGSPAPPPAP